MAANTMNVILIAYINTIEKSTGMYLEYWGFRVALRP